MKKISLKTFRKSFNLSKSKEETDFMVVQQPSIASDFGKDDALFGSCYGKDMASCDINSEDEKGGKNRSKSESLMGTLKRWLSSKQKPKGKGSTPSGSCAADDTFSSSSAPMVFKDVRVKKPIRSTSLRSQHYTHTPWPRGPTNSEETYIKTEVRVKALVHSSSPSPALNAVRKDFHDLQSETVCQEQNNSLKSSDSPNGDLHFHLDEHVPVVIERKPQDYIQYTVPLDERMYPLEGSRSYCLNSSLPMEVSAVPPQVGGSSFAEDENEVNQDLVVAPEIFVDQSVNGLLIGITGVMLQSPRASRDDVPPLSPLVPTMQNNQIQRNFSGLTGTDAHVAESMCCHLNFDPYPNSAPGVARVYDSVQSSGPRVVASLTEELKKLAKQGWYWGPLTRWEAEGKLANLPDGSFLVRDSSDDHYLLSLSFRSHGKPLHKN
ncbi:Suppressor of cytokine signaling 6 [Heterocephalus glaber]|uniref:Suppressor of cytokine signaling 6 n=1 Tax=Heterocephalus glaber TaxID=10181 RepID=G5BD92_HETGA|nr:Suppressor of cytokine signaling 6 [Heterocephalus glaber]